MVHRYRRRDAVRRLLFAASLIVTAAAAQPVNITQIAAGTTIAVNALEIRSTTAKALKVWKAARKAAAKTAKRVRGK